MSFLPSSYINMLQDLFQHPRKKDPDDRKGWYKNHAANGDPTGLDPWKWSLIEVNDELKKLEFD